MSQEYDPHDTHVQDAADAQEEDAKALQRRIEVDDFKWLMSSKQGRRVMWRLLGLAGVFRNPFAGAGSESQTAFNCGLQAMGQTLIGEIHELCPEQYHQMVKEQQKRNGKRHAADDRN